MTATKSPEAFRTISEVADDLGVPQHVLRFWETKFSQIKPLKRGGGRRYYRPNDIDLLKGIQTLLHEEGYTIRGVQKVFRKQGVRFVVGIGRADMPAVEPIPTGAITAAAPPLSAHPMPPAPEAKVAVRTSLPPEMDAPQQLSLVPEEALPVTTKEYTRLANRLETLMDLRTQLTAALEAREERLADEEPAEKGRAASA